MGTFIRSEHKFGNVIRTSKTAVWVSIDSDCPSKNSGCTGGCGSCGGELKSKKTMIPCTEAQKYAVGDKIHFQHYSLNENLVAFIVFGIPIASAFFAILGWYAYSPQMVESAQSFLSAAAALIAGFVVVRYIDIWFRTKYPSIILSKNSIKTDRVEI